MTYIHIPPLRERKRDIIPNARHLLRNLSEEATLPEIKLAKETETLLKTHDWPGNVREISNVLERALSALDDETIEPDHLPSNNTAGRSVRRYRKTRGSRRPRHVSKRPPSCGHSRKPTIKRPGQPICSVFTAPCFTRKKIRHLVETDPNRCVFHVSPNGLERPIQSIEYKVLEISVLKPLNL